MRVAHILVSMSRNSGGLFHSVAGLAKAEAAMPGMEIDVHGVRDEFSSADAEAWKPLAPCVHPPKGPGFLGWSPQLRDAVAHGDYDIVHNHGLWQEVSRVGADWRRKTGRPHIVSPRGMLDAWALANSGWKKKLAGAVFEDRHLQEATCLHALCDSEADAIRAYGLRNPIAVVPNGVALPETKQRGGELRVASNGSGGPKTLLFLGRLHPKKGLPEALKAWAEVTRGGKSGWRFVIAGWDQGGHEAELKRLCGELGLPYVETRNLGTKGRSDEGMGGEWEESSVVFAGPAFGETKDALLRSADAFILPSLSEGLPMSVLEAWAYGLPVLMTEECNLPEGFAAQAAIRIGAAAPSDEWRVTSGEWGGVSVDERAEPSGARQTGVQRQPRSGIAGGRDQIGYQRSTGVAVALRELMAMSESGRAEMGARGRALVEERFTWPRVAAQMKQVYDWVLGNGARPDFVRVVGN